MTIFLSTQNGNVVPFSIEQVIADIESNKLSPDTLGWHDGLIEWTPLCLIPALQEACSTSADQQKPMKWRSERWRVISSASVLLIGLSVVAVYIFLKLDRQYSRGSDVSGSREHRPESVSSKTDSFTNELEVLLVSAAENDPKLQQDSDAQLLVGLAYLKGEHREKDAAKAFIYIHKAATNGNAKAQCALASMYAAGAGTQKDNIEAYKWLLAALKAAETPKDTADLQTFQRSLKDKMTADEIGEAERRAQSEGL